MQLHGIVTELKTNFTRVFRVSLNSDTLKLDIINSIAPCDYLFIAIFRVVFTLRTKDPIGQLLLLLLFNDRWNISFSE